MKTKNLIFAICLLLFTSCVVKSLHPFYTKETIYFDENFIGEWQDKKEGNWRVIRFGNMLFADNETNFDSLFTKGNLDFKIKIRRKELTKEDKKLYSKYKNSYYIQREYKDKKIVFVATPFKINNQTFLDFLPLEHQDDIDNLLESHSIYTHSLVKYDIKKNGEVEIKWLDEDKIEELFKQKNIKIKHEIVGVLDSKYLLTASSLELQKFIKKYMASNDDEKWNTSTKFTLTKTNGTD